MKPVKITEANAPKIDALLADAQTRCTVRTCDAWHVANAIKDAEEKLAGMLYKKDWTGLRIECDPHAQSFPNAYKGTPESTQFTIERRAGGWFLVDVARRRTGTHTQDVSGLAEKTAEMVRFAEDHFHRV